jgi:nitronate monooxygenase
MILDSAAADIVYTLFRSGVHGNDLKRSIAAQDLDPDNLPVADKKSMNFASTRVKAWTDIWGVGLGAGHIRELPSTRVLVERLREDYAAARAKLLASARTTATT